MREEFVSRLAEAVVLACLVVDDLRPASVSRDVDAVDLAGEVHGDVTDRLEGHTLVERQRRVLVPTRSSSEARLEVGGEIASSGLKLVAQPQQPPLDPNAPATAIKFELESGHEHWLGLHNFYVITRYNHSSMYAMSVYQLSQLLAVQIGE